MADQNQLELLKRGVSEWNMWRHTNPSIEIDLSHSDLSGADLTGANLIGADLTSADLRGARFRKAMITAANFHRAHLRSADLREADFSTGSPDLSPANFTEADLQDANLQGVSFIRRNPIHHGGSSPLYRFFIGVDFSRADLSFANLRGADLRASSFHRANLDGADLSSAELESADFYNASLSSAYLSEALLFRSNFSRSDLLGADLRGANLREASLYAARLSYAKLSDTDLRRANLSYALLYHADLSEADLRRANLSYALLYHVDLSGANLHQANISEAEGFDRSKNLNQADLAGAIMAVPIETLPESMVSKVLGIPTYNSNRRTTKHTTEFHLRIDETPLYLHHVAHVLSALTDLGVLCWLTAQGRYRDVVTYTQTRDLRIAEEAPFVITDVSYGSFDATINFSNLDPKNIAEALHTGLDTFLLAGERLKQARLDTETKAAQLQQEQKQAELDYQAKQQELATAAQKAAQDEQLAQLELDRQKFELERQHLLSQIEYDRQRLEVERQRVALQRELAELERTRMTYAIEAANTMISMVAPDADQAARAMLVQSYLPSLLQFHAVPNLPLQFSVEKSDSDTNVDEQVGPAPSETESDL